MKKFLSVLFNVVLFLIISAAVVAGCFYCYENCADFKALFGSGGTEVLGKTDIRQSLAARSERAGLLSLYIFTGIIVIQFLALFIAVAVLKKISRSGETAKVKLSKLANADIFLDLPLYIGLFGSVSSFMVMSFSSSSGQLIAYSSTLIGIIFCTCLRVFLMYPLKSRLISEAGQQ
ncbi:MAG: hypothetical protein E7039_04465 [Lentisphaerae bacterium]|nr:hypothetical protein [Lentisphaerota bacterium]